MRFVPRPCWRRRASKEKGRYVPRLLAAGHVPGYWAEDTTYFLGRETVIPTKHPGMAIWREKIFAFMSRNAQPATALFNRPPERVTEMGAQIEI